MVHQGVDIDSSKSNSNYPIYSGLYKSLIQYIDLSDLTCDRRGYVSVSSVKVFSKSLTERGFLRPLFIDADKKIVDGRKRFAAASSIGYTKIPCVFSPNPLVFEDDLLINDIRSENCDFFKCAEMLYDLTEIYLYSQEETAQAIGRSQSFVANKLRLLNFTEEERDEVVKGCLTERHCRSLLRIKNLELRLKAIRAIASASLSVSAADEYISALLSEQCALNRTEFSSSLERFAKSFSDKYETVISVSKSDNGSETYTLSVRPKRFT